MLEYLVLNIKFLVSCISVCGRLHPQIDHACIKFNSYIVIVQRTNFWSYINLTFVYVFLTSLSCTEIVIILHKSIVDLCRYLKYTWYWPNKGIWLLVTAHAELLWLHINIQASEPSRWFSVTFCLQSSHLY